MFILRNQAFSGWGSFVLFFASKNCSLQSNNAMWGQKAQTFFLTVTAIFQVSALWTSHAANCHNSGWLCSETAWIWLDLLAQGKMQIWLCCCQSQPRSKKSQVSFICQRNKTNSCNLSWSCASQNGCFSTVYPKLEVERRVMHCY